MTNLTLAPNLPLPYAAGLGSERPAIVGKDFLLEIGYVGTKGTKLPRFVEGNPAQFIPGESTADNVNQRRLHFRLWPRAIRTATVSTLHGLDYRQYKLLVQRAGSECAQAFQSRPVIPGFVYVLESIDYASSFNMTGSAAKTRRW